MKISEMYRAIAPIGPTSLDKPQFPASSEKINKSEFADLLQRQVGEAQDAERGFKLSNHAATRIRSREINWSPELEQRVKHGIDSAEAKGSREALILAGDVAIIANVPSRTVITAMDSGNLKEKVFTNIDSAVLV
jgi:flagellar operon protein